MRVCDEMITMTTVSAQKAHRFAELHESSWCGATVPAPLFSRLFGDARLSMVECQQLLTGQYLEKHS
jgi:hypothetical protein